MTQIETLKLALEALESNRRTHYYCEDTWYSCPKHEDGCANDSEGDECNCGADKANAGIDQAITAIKAALEAKDEPVVLKFPYSNLFDVVQCPTCNATIYTESTAPQKPALQKSELEKDAVNLLFALHDAWPYVHQHCTIESKKKSIQAIIVKHGEFADLQPPQQEAKDEPVAWDGYNLDDMCEAFNRVIEEHFHRKHPFHDPVNNDAMIALRTLRGFIPYMKRHTTPPQRKPLTDEEINALDYSGTRIEFVRAIEAAHGIKGEA